MACYPGSDAYMTSPESQRKVKDLGDSQLTGFGSGSIANLNIFQTLVFLSQYSDFNLNVKFEGFKAEYLFRFVCVTLVGQRN